MADATRARLQFAKSAPEALQMFMDYRHSLTRVAHALEDGTLARKAEQDSTLLDEVANLQEVFGKYPWTEATLLNDAPVLFWTSATTRMVQEAAATYPLKDEAAVDLATVAAAIQANAPVSKPSYLPHLMSAFCVFDQPWETVTIDGQAQSFSALGWRIYVEKTHRSVRLAVRGIAWRDGAAVPVWWSDGGSQDPEVPIFNDTEGTYEDERRRLIRWVCAASMFIQQELVGHDPVHVGGQIGKRAARELITPTCQVIVLRHELAQAESRPPGITDVEWSHRWVVRGHWRRQYYPARQAHVPVWIHPHIKGPADKPLVVSEAVYAVTR